MAVAVVSSSTISGVDEDTISAGSTSSPTSAPPPSFFSPSSIRGGVGVMLMESKRMDWISLDLPDARYEGVPFSLSFPSR